MQKPEARVYCSKCGETKPGNEFHRDKTRPNGLSAYCKNCKKTWQLEIRHKVFAAYGGKCVCCGESTFEFLSIDHIHRDGAAQRKELNRTGGWMFYLWIVKNNFPDTLQILCFNCNLAKGFYGECPHEKVRNISNP